MTPWDELADALQAKEEAKRTGDAAAYALAYARVADAREHMSGVAWRLLRSLVEPPCPWGLPPRGLPPDVIRAIASYPTARPDHLEPWLGQISAVQGQCIDLMQENRELACWLAELQKRVETLEYDLAAATV